MRRHFEEQLDDLHTELVAMGTLCEKAIALAIRTLFDDDADLEREAAATEEAIDSKERSIENLCLRLLLQQQPVAGDLRSVSAALRMISDMERIGDQSRDIAEIAVEMQECPACGEDEVMPLIKGMATASADMVTRSIDAFVRQDVSLARAVREADATVDALFARVRRNVAALMGGGSRQGELCLDLLMIAKYFERIGDHAVNIAEWVEFALTGRHAGERL